MATEQAVVNVAQSTTGMKIVPSLSESDLRRWVDAITSQPTMPSEFLPWVETKLRDFFPYSCLFMAHGELVAGQIKTTHWLASGHEPQYLQQLATTFELKHRGSLQWWFENRRPFTIDPAAPPAFASQLEVEEIKIFNLRNVAAHGVLNSRSNAGTYFSFTGVSSPLSNWHIEALRLLAPVLNDLYLTHIAAQTPPSQAPLTQLTVRQKDIVRRVALAEDTKSIARELGIAEKTVRNQLTEVYAQLGIATRTQLLALLR
ncbi:MAG: helix-turn-helix transcriptional regulator [Polaromonas sp.]